MEKEIRNGTIIKLDIEDEKEYIIVDNIVKNEKQYLVLHPFELEEGQDTVEIDYQNLTIVELKEDDDYEYLEDRELIKEIITELLEK
ncbi:MAG: hypothetical protein IJ867_06825 [Clostridia bacterium]|nr:hypothetical protein [Clostridia bacterium]